jgi:hypothetical protein
MPIMMVGGKLDQKSRTSSSHLQAPHAGSRVEFSTARVHTARIQTFSADRCESGVVPS